MTMQGSQGVGSSQISTGLFGAVGSSLSSGFGGLQGLFAHLLGRVGGAEGLFLGTAGTAGISLGKGEVLDSTALSGLLEGMDLDITSLENMTIEQVTMQLQQVTIALEQSGISLKGLEGMESAQELAAALEHLGMDSEDAVEQAVRIETALEYVKSKLAGKDGENSLLSIVGILHQNVELQQSISIPQIEVSQTQITFVEDAPVRQQQNTAFAVQQQTAPVTDVASSVVLDKPLLPEKETAQSRQMLNVKTAKTTPVASFENTLILENLAEKTEALTDIKQAVETTVEIQQQTVKAPIYVNMETTQNVSESAMPAVTANIKLHKESSLGSSNMVDEISQKEGYNRSQTPVEAPRPIEGATVYKWQISKVGMDILTQVEEMPQQLTINAAMDAANMAEIEGEVTETSQQNNSPKMTFAERVNQFVKAAQLGNQVQNSMRTLISEGGGQVRITLNPEELGEIEIELNIKDGLVQGKIASQNPDVIEQLARELHHLKQGLNESGFKLGEEGIAFMLQQDENGQQSQQDEGEDDTANSEVTESEAQSGEEAAVTAKTWKSPDKLIDVNV